MFYLFFLVVLCPVLANAQPKMTMEDFENGLNSTVLSTMIDLLGLGDCKDAIFKMYHTYEDNKKNGTPQKLDVMGIVKKFSSIGG
ncbi:hypothetical protein DdX_00938 [Ditylenchus destructor]|uniref:Uncharacterized protein n=1 Tax=Ditylenchus destructor TaxID=166010 RepID=A0AAD4NG30_9BILA|nr:hypothetical protein DdX_00938 [Ditylenchus destructor]